MAEPIEFEGQNFVYTKPADMAHEECGSLPTLRQDGTNISCWKLTPEELTIVNRTGVVWLGVLGSGMPPVYISACRPFIFNDEVSDPLGHGPRRG